MAQISPTTPSTPAAAGPMPGQEPDYLAFKQRIEYTRTPEPLVRHVWLVEQAAGGPGTSFDVIRATTRRLAFATWLIASGRLSDR